MHRLWAWILVIFSITLASLIGLAWYAIQLPFDTALLTLLVPALTPFKELANLIRANFDNANTKESAERTLNELWEKGVVQNKAPHENQLRSLQDKILILRQTNAYVPDWLDSIFHERNEAAMRASVEDRVAQAKRYGRG
jgi:hypothetical protein